MENPGACEHLCPVIEESFHHGGGGAENHAEGGRSLFKKVRQRAGKYGGARDSQHIGFFENPFPFLPGHRSGNLSKL